MVRPERRTKSDLAAVAAIVAVVLVGATILWLRSDARATVSESANAPVSTPSAPATVPAGLAEVWRAPSSATPEPVVVGSSVVTGEGSETIGRDPVTGAQRWRYARNLPLCTIGAEWNRAIAVYRKGSFCSEVTSLEGSTGKRGPQRNSDAKPGTRLLSDGTYVTATGQRSVESWRSDLVRTQQFGLPPDLKNPDNGMSRPPCEYTSTAVNDDRVALIEQCPQDSGGRITVIKARPEDDEKPEEVISTGVGSPEAAVVGVSETHTAVLLRNRSTVLIYNNSTASVQEQFTVPEGVGPAPADGVEPTSTQRLWTVSVQPQEISDISRTARALAVELGRIDPRITEESILAGAAATPPGKPYQVAVLSDDEHQRVAKKIDNLSGVELGGIVYWHTGKATVALDANTFARLWAVPATVGPGTLFGGELVLPVQNGVAVHDRTTGAFKRLIPVDRQGYPGMVSLNTVGDVLLEQRGPSVVALR